MTREEIIRFIIEKKITISFAESCTGGALASAFVKMPGASEVFNGSFVVYSPFFKEKYLGVKEETINQKGVVSKEVAEEMAEGLSKETGVFLSISVTGNCGPSKGDLKAPLGRVYVCLLYNGLKDTFELNLKGSREENIESVVDFVFDAAFDTLNNL
ncbi:MAG: CinA family protein [Bacillales bacterium]|nr:CinA family protein [Bacillales bacterium]